MLGKFGLNQDFAGQGSAPGAPGHLRDGLCETFRGPKIAGEQSLVRIEHHHQTNLRKMVPLGEHLCADQYPRLPAMDTIEHGLQGAACGCGVPVQSRERRIREQTRQCFLDPLGALTHRIQCLTATCANRGNSAVRAAVMAAQLPCPEVQGHSRIAMGARRDPAAGIAEQPRGVAAAVQEHDDLPACLQMPRHGLHHGCR